MKPRLTCFSYASTVSAINARFSPRDICCPPIKSRYRRLRRKLSAFDWRIWLSLNYRRRRPEGAATLLLLLNEVAFGSWPSLLSLPRRPEPCDQSRRSEQLPPAHHSRSAGLSAQRPRSK